MQTPGTAAAKAQRRQREELAAPLNNFALLRAQKTAAQSIPSVSARRLDEAEIFEIKIGSRLQLLAGGSVVQGDGHCLEPLHTFRL